MNQPPVWAALFDLDGLLIDSEPLWQQAEVAVFGRLGVPLTRQDCASTMGWRIDAVVAHWHRRHGWSGPSVAEVVEQIVAEVVRLVSTQGQALPGVLRALQVCKDAGLRLAVASSSRQVIIQAAVDALGIADHFELLQSAQAEPYGKPHPGVFLQAAARLGVDPHHCIVFEDSPPGILAAEAAGMVCIAVPSAHAVEPHTLAIADLVLPELGALRRHHLQALMYPSVCQVRPAQPADWPAIDRVVRAAFGQPDEADLVQALRRDGSSAGEWVAIGQGQVVGHILYTRLVLAEPPELRLVALAPLSTDPAWQR
ncbi:MAG: hexitol phosphatase HxpB, partial [Deltaproteobacteria bacterium]|nr:hexitol phosphatase HxpB [Deltaproteobacteria bacterium]